MYLFFLFFVFVSLSQGEILVDCPSNAAAECVKVGFSYSGTGDRANEGLYLRNGYVLWADRLNSLGGVNQNDQIFVQLIGEDDATVLDNVISIYEDLATSVNFFLGPFGSSFSIAAATVAEANGIPIILSNAASNRVFEKGFTIAFGVGTLASNYCPPAISLYGSAGASTYYLAYSTTGFATEVAEGCLDALAASTSATLLGNETFQSTLKLPEAGYIVINAQESGADVFLSIGLLSDGYQFSAAGSRLEYNPNGWFMTSAPGNPEFVETANSNHLVGPSQWASHVEGYSDDFWGTAQDYTKIYEKEFGAEELDEVSYIAAGASVSGTILHLAIGTTDSIDTADVLAALRATNQNTFFGPIAFNADGSNSVKQIVLTQVIRGEIEVVWPPEHESKEFVYPGDFSSSSALTFTTFSLFFSFLFWNCF